MLANIVTLEAPPRGIDATTLGSIIGYTGFADRVVAILGEYGELKFSHLFLHLDLFKHRTAQSCAGELVVNSDLAHKRGVLRVLLFQLSFFTDNR
jgi:hypothetical protein